MTKKKNIKYCYVTKIHPSQNLNILLHMACSTPEDLGPRKRRKSIDDNGEAITTVSKKESKLPVTATPKSGKKALSSNKTSTSTVNTQNKKAKKPTPKINPKKLPQHQPSTNEEIPNDEG